MKKVNFREVIPQFTALHTGYGPHVDWEDLPSTFERWSQKDLTGKYGRSGLDLSPDYQRDHVWSEDQKIAYLEYVMKGGLSGKEIYFNCPGWSSDYSGVTELVDGKQRVDAILRFVNNEIEVFGKYLFGDFDRLGTNCHVILKMNTLKTRKEILNWYLEFNSGGTIHTEEELDKVRKMLEQ